MSARRNKAEHPKRLVKLGAKPRSGYFVDGPDGFPKLAVTKKPGQYFMVELAKGDLHLHAKKLGVLNGLLEEALDTAGREGRDLECEGKIHELLRPDLPQRPTVKDAFALLNDELAEYDHTECNHAEGHCQHSGAFTVLFMLLEQGAA